MSGANALLEAYQALTTLDRELIARLGQGLDLEALAPLFDRKAALTRELAQIPAPAALEDAKTRSELLQAQKEASLAEAELVKALQPFVSSIGKTTFLKPQDEAERPGKRWDFLG